MRGYNCDCFNFNKSLGCLYVPYHEVSCFDFSVFSLSSLRQCLEIIVQKFLHRYEKHMAFHRKFPEKFSPESILAEQGTLTAQYQTLPIYFSNVCLRFLPVSGVNFFKIVVIGHIDKISISLIS